MKSRHEKVVAESLRGKNYSEFLPLYSARCRSGRSFKDVQLPLFPGYVFCRFDIHRRLPILTTPGVLLVVKTGDDFCPVEEQEISFIQTVVNSGLDAQPWPFLKEGDHVHVEEGPVRGLDGILLSVKNTHRLVVSVTLLQRSVAVEIDRCWVRPVSIPKPAAASGGSPVFSAAGGCARAMHVGA